MRALGSSTTPLKYMAALETKTPPSAKPRNTSSSAMRSPSSTGRAEEGGLMARAEQPDTPGGQGARRRRPVAPARSTPGGRQGARPSRGDHTRRVRSEEVDTASEAD